MHYKYVIYIYYKYILYEFIYKKLNKNLRDTTMAKKNELVEIKKNGVGYGLLIENDGYVKMSKKSIKEALGDDGGEWNVPYPFIVDAVFQKYGIKNANGRVYPEGVLKKQVELYQQKINEHRAIGECNHPSESVIDLGRVSHNIIELHWEGHTLVGKMELNVSMGFVKHGICSTLGDTVANLLMNGYKIGVSSRGIGSVEQRLGQTIVGDDYELICWDVVSDPSTPNAWIGNSEELQQYVEDTEKHGNTINEISTTEDKIDKMRNILKS